MSYQRRLFFFIFGLMSGACLLQNCAIKKNHSAQHNSDQTTDSSSVEVRYAKGFSIQRFPDHTLIRVFNPFQNRADTLRYVLVPRDQSVPKHQPKAQIIRTPICSMIATSTTHIALTERLNADDVIKGMVGAEYAYSKDIRGRLDAGKITAFSQGEFNNEVALNMSPDVVMISAGQASQYDNYRLLVDSGIAVFANAEWLERTPLGKAEWLKVMGALLGKPKLAKEKFNKVARHYNNLKAKAKKASDNPLVINNMPHKGAWFVSGGDSFTAQYLKDAAADYSWYDNKSTGGLRLSFESVYDAGLRADVWINPGTATTKNDVLAVDSRFRDFKSFQNGRIYNNNKRMSPTGGNDFWETGVVRPDLILSDLITIFHPNVMTSDSLYFYQKVK